VPDAHFVGEGGALPERVSTDDLLAQLELIGPQNYRLNAEPGAVRISGGDASLTLSGRAFGVATATTDFSAEVVRNGRVVPPEFPPGIVPPSFLVTAVITKATGIAADGEVVVAIAPAWRRVLEELSRDPTGIHQLGARRLEELVAASYEREGYHVILTPRSGDDGVDVIATSRGANPVRIIEQVKAYGPGRKVTADDVRAVLGVLSTMPDVSKGIVTTTGEFAPRIRENPRLTPYMPTRLELRDRTGLFEWFDRLLRADDRLRN
jgi:restriction system protein